LLAADPDGMAAELKDRKMTAEVICDWQDQARLVCVVPQLRGHDAQILVACGYREAAKVASANAEKLLAAAIKFAASSEGQRVLRSSPTPDAEEIADWIRWAGQSRTLRAA
jgi:hypothetical protein